MPKATKLASVAPQVTSSEMIHLTKYPRMVQRYFIKLDDVVTEVFRVNTKSQAVEGAKLFDIITSSGNTHVFATEVTEVVRMTQAEKNREVARLKAEFEAGTIDHATFSDQIVRLI